MASALMNGQTRPSGRSYDRREFRPTKLDDALSRISEECSEVIKIVCKAQRFGLNDTHPAKGKRNIELLSEEMGDVENAYRDSLRILRECQPTAAPSDAP